MKETPISPLHRQWGACMDTEAEWRMPRQFHSLIEEHLSVRSSCAVFDISHIAKLSVVGNGSLEWLEGVLSNSISRCRDHHVQRTLLLEEGGGIIDKLTLLRESAGRFFLLGHAAMAGEDFRQLAQHKPKGPIELTDETERWSGMTLTGPDCEEVFHRAMPDIELPDPMAFHRGEYGGDELIVAHAGLQGEEGVQVLCPANRGIRWFEAFVGAGAVPCGFATRENLRITGGAPCCLRDIRGATPHEASLECLCDMEKNYIGSAAVVKAAQNPPEKKIVTLRCPEDSDLPDTGTAILDEKGDMIGRITTACVAPEQGRTLAFAVLQNRFSAPGTRVELLLPRGLVPAVVLGPPVP